jgi:hypothetical protein
MEKIVHKLHKFLFPKHYRALKEAIQISFTYWEKSPVQAKREVGEDIYMRIIKIIG